MDFRRFVKRFRRNAAIHCNRGDTFGHSCRHSHQVGFAYCNPSTRKLRAPCRARHFALIPTTPATAPSPPLPPAKPASPRTTDPDCDPCFTLERPNARRLFSRAAAKHGGRLILNASRLGACGLSLAGAGPGGNSDACEPPRRAIQPRTPFPQRVRQLAVQAESSPRRDALGVRRSPAPEGVDRHRFRRHAECSVSPAAPPSVECP